MMRATVSADGETIAILIPLTFRNRGGRKLAVTPDEADWVPRPGRQRHGKALSRAFRWRKMVDEGVIGRIDELARANGIGKTYVSHVLKLTLLAPKIVEAILDGR